MSTERCQPCVEKRLRRLLTEEREKNRALREASKKSTKWLWALQEIVDGDYGHIDEVVTIAQKGMEAALAGEGE